jgi:hypothetical protein
MHASVMHNMPFRQGCCSAHPLGPRAEPPTDAISRDASPKSALDAQELNA